MHDFGVYVSTRFAENLYTTAKFTTERTGLSFVKLIACLTWFICIVLLLIPSPGYSFI